MPANLFGVSDAEDIRADRMWAILDILKKEYPTPKSEMAYSTPIQHLANVIMSAQYTDKAVNALNTTLWKKYVTVEDFANARIEDFAQDIQSVSYFNSKAKYIVESARKILKEFSGRVPDNKPDLLTLPGVGSKTANVVLGELYDIWSGIAVDTHVKRFVYRFDLCDSTNPDIIERELCAIVPKQDWKYVNHGFVMLGRYTCKARKHDCTLHAEPIQSLFTEIYPPACNRWPEPALRYTA
jgi:endonuclease-3